MSANTREIGTRELQALLVRMMCLVTVSIVVAIVVVLVARDMWITQALNAGADPIAVACAYGTSRGDACALATASAGIKRVNQ